MAALRFHFPQGSRPANGKGKMRAQVNPIANPLKTKEIKAQPLRKILIKLNSPVARLKKMAMDRKSHLKMVKNEVHKVVNPSPTRTRKRNQPIKFIQANELRFKREGFEFRFEIRAFKVYPIQFEGI